MSNFFVAVDVETANASRASICQIGLVASDGKNELWRWSSFVDPEEGFEHQNVKMHGLHSGQVFGAPPFPAVMQSIRSSIANQCVVSWSEFDQDALAQALTEALEETMDSDTG